MLCCNNENNLLLCYIVTLKLGIVMLCCNIKNKVLLCYAVTLKTRHCYVIL